MFLKRSLKSTLRVSYSSAFLTIAFLAVTGLTSVVQAEENPVRLGAILPLSGGASFIGGGARIGIRAALQKINQEEGGVLGRKLEVVFEDTRSDPKLTVPSYQRLVEKYDPPVILTALRNTALLLEPLANQEGRLLFVESSRPDLIQKPGFMLRSFFTTDQTNEALVTRLKNKFLNNVEMQDRNLRLGVLYADEDWTQPVVEDLDKRLVNSRIQLVARQAFKRDAILKNELPKLKASKLDALLVLGLGKSAASIYQQLHDNPVSVETYGLALCNDDDLFASAKQYLQGVYSVGPKLDRKGHLYERLQRIYEQERPGEPVDLTSISMFNAVMILAEAIRSHAETPSQLRQFILKKKDFEGIAGKVSFDEKGDAKWKASVDRITSKGCEPVAD